MGVAGYPGEVPALMVSLYACGPAPALTNGGSSLVCQLVHWMRAGFLT